MPRGTSIVAILLFFLRYFHLFHFHHAFWAIKSMLTKQGVDYLAGFVVLYTWRTLQMVHDSSAEVVGVATKDHYP